MIDINKVCFFTGHRKIKEELRENIRFLLRREIINKYNNGIKTFISGCASGFDLLAASIVLNLKQEIYSDIELMLYIPNYSYEEKYLTYRERCELLYYKVRAYDIKIIDKEFNNVESIKKRNCKMVDDSCCGISYFTNFRSGSYQTYSYAKKQGKDVVNLAELI